MFMKNKEMSKKRGYNIIFNFMIWLLVVNLNVVYAKKPIDSLEIDLKLQTKSDTARVNFLNKIAFENYKIDLDNTIKYVNQAQSLAQEINYKKGQARSLVIVGIVKKIKSKFEESIQCFEQALTLYELEKDSINIADCLSKIGLIHCNQASFEEGLKYFYKSIDVNTKINHLEGLATNKMNIGKVYSYLEDYSKAIKYTEEALAISKGQTFENKMAIGCLNTLGINYAKQGNYPLALEYFNEVLIINEEIGDSNSISSGLNNIGILYKDQGNYKKSIEYYSRSIAISEALFDTISIVNSNINIGINYSKQGLDIQAIENFKSALAMGVEINDKSIISSCLNNIGKSQLILKEYSQALESFKTALEINQDIKTAEGIASSHLGIATVYKHQGDFKKALLHGIKGQKIAVKLELAMQKRESSRLLSEIFYALGDFEMAYKNHVDYKKLSDDLFNKENIQKIAQLEYEFTYQKKLSEAKERELKLTDEVKMADKFIVQSQKQTFLAIIGFLVLTIILVVIISVLKIKNIRSENQNILIEQKLLRSQMTPHFIFNSLSILQGLILNAEYKKSITYYFFRKR